ncbi:MAG TPA: wax ester/triacylglycerol synthase family O-acyltransferase [Solirubrobacteraceae bacterium]|nr:wax ester/triacylglycerol synthase family O-acyltransferase [Solirubrobacteraceae bacterium]
MAQQHLDRLSAIDASFLHQEGPTSHMHVGGLAIFAGPPPRMEEVIEQVRGRLHLVPRYRQRLAHTPLDSGRPVWVDDPNFNLEYHFRHTALPPPGDRAQLLRLTARINSQQLDRSKPLWETWFVEGLEDGRFALIWKTHHALIDGIAGVDLATVLFDLSPAPPAVENSGTPWQPQPEPGTASLLAAGVLGAMNAAIEIATHAVDAATHPERAFARVREATEGIGEVAWAALNPAPETPLNVQIGPHRRFVGVACRLDDFKLIKNTFGGTVNDVVLSVVSGALRSFLEDRGVRTEELELRALVPVSVRTKDERNQFGNRIAAMRAALPVYVEDPVTRLDVVRQAMDGLKESKQALGAEVISGVQNFAPPTILAQASRINFSTRLFNLLVTNIPGPQFPLYVLGHELEEVFPVAFLPRKHALAVAIMSYNGAINFGLLGDYDALPDIDRIAESLERELAALLVLAVGAAAQATAAGAAAAEAAPVRRAKPTRRAKPRTTVAAEPASESRPKPKPKRTSKPTPEPEPAATTKPRRPRKPTPAAPAADDEASAPGT